MQLVVPIGYEVWVWCDMTLSILKLLTVRSWRSDANTVLSEKAKVFLFWICTRKTFYDGRALVIGQFCEVARTGCK